MSAVPITLLKGDNDAVLRDAVRQSVVVGVQRSVLMVIGLMKYHNLNL